MASLPENLGPVVGRVDRRGRLVSADPQLASLQVEAGSHVGAELALPQLAAIARLVFDLGVPVSRAAIVAGGEQDIDLWVDAKLEGDDVILSLERWRSRPAAAARLSGHLSHEREQAVAGELDDWAVDQELRIVSLSHGLADEIGISPDAAAGQPLTRLLRLEENEDGILPLVAGLAARTDFQGQRARPQASPNKLLFLSGRVVSGRDGNFAGFRGSSTSEGLAAEQRKSELAELDAALDQALLSPLDRIIQNADRMAQQVEGPLQNEYADYANDIASAARHLLSVVRSMAGDDDRLDQVEVDTLALDAVAMLESVARERNVRVEVTGSGPLLAKGDPRGIVQILVNLIGNAIRHSPDGSAVTILKEQAAESAHLHVIDSGPGIDPGDQQRIFERFEQGKPGEGGTGLGLAIARRLARAMGGDILLESAPGEGSRFTLVLQLA